MLAAVNALAFSVRRDGVVETLRRAGRRLFGREEWLVVVRRIEPPAAPVRLPVEVDGLTIRGIQESDIDALAEAMPFDLDRRGLAERRMRLRERLPVGLVAVRGGRIAGAAWYLDRVEPDQPWYEAVRPSLELPARFTAAIFVVPGEKAAAWSLSRVATDWLGEGGVRSLVALVRVENRPSLLLARMLGGRVVARQTVRRNFGRTTIDVVPVPDDRAFPAGEAKR